MQVDIEQHRLAFGRHHHMRLPNLFKQRSCTLRHSVFPFTSFPATEPWVPHISLVFREMWDTDLRFFVRAKVRQGLWHPTSRPKTSEIWGTQNAFTTEDPSPKQRA